MKRMIIALVLLIAAASLSSALTRGMHPSRVDKSLVIRITSKDPKEVLSFDASYLFKTGDPALQHIEQVTPFEVKGQSELVIGIFHKTRGEANLEVEIVTDEQGEERLQGRGSGETIILGRDVPSKGQSFVQAF